MNKFKYSVTLLFLAALAAGFGISECWHRSHRIPAGPTWLSGLDLTIDQFQKMNAIWDPMRDEVHTNRVKEDEIMHEKDLRLKDLLSEGQKGVYLKIQQETEQRIKEEDDKLKKLLDEAVEQTKEFLSEPQRQKFDELHKKQMERRTRHFAQ